MTTHNLKTDYEAFQAVAAGLKTFEIRRDDRGFQVGDKLNLLETVSTGAEMAAGAPLEYTGGQVWVTVTHIMRGPVYGLADGWAVLSIKEDCSGGMDFPEESASAPRSLLAQYDREQQPGHRDGYEDGRLKGYEVGQRHGAEAARSKAPQPSDQWHWVQFDGADSQPWMPARRDGNCWESVGWRTPNVLTVGQVIGAPKACTCPSGDGSLSWPCPQHPPSPQPAPVDASDAPEGFVARLPGAPSVNHDGVICRQCAFENLECPKFTDRGYGALADRCNGEYRADRQEVIFVRREPT